MAASIRAHDSSTLSLPKWQWALLIGAPIAVGVGYWYYTSRNTKAQVTSEKPIQKEDAGKTVLQQVTTETSSSLANANGTPAPKKDAEVAPKAAKPEPTKSEPVEPEETDPFKLSQAFKNKGNKYFKAGRYADAIKCYQQAIDICPADKVADISTFYQNRAAAYEQLKNHEAVVADCTKALEYNKKYVKALHRRAKANELLKQFERALEDITAVCILEQFQNQSSLLTADRVLKELGKLHAKEAMTTRQPIMPSVHFIRTFISSFSEDPVFALIKDQQQSVEDSEPRKGFSAAVKAVTEQNYEAIIPACTEEIDSGNDDNARNLSLLLRATFYSLIGEHEKALQDFSTVVDNQQAGDKLRVNALVKRATLRLQLGAPEESLHDLEMAAALGPEISDVYHHRGQVNMLLDNVAAAMSDFEKAVALNGQFPIALVQKLYTDYRMGLSMNDASRVQEAMKAFQEAIQKFPECPECYLLYAQVLSDQQEYKKADEYFKKALEVDPLNATTYVHRGLLQLQWQGNVDEARRLISKAIEMDGKCEFAYETLGTIEVQRGNLKQAIELFDKAIPLARTEIEMSHLFSLKDAALAQVKVVENLGITVPSQM